MRSRKLFRTRSRARRPELMEHLESRTLLSAALGAAVVAHAPVVAVVASRSATSELSTAADGQFTLVRTGKPTDPLTVTYSISGTATSGSDFVPLSGSATFGAGESRVKIALDALPDNLAEGNETVILSVNAGAGYDVSGRRDSARVIIRDAAPTVSVASFKRLASEVNGDTTGAARIVLRRTGDLTDPLTANFTLTGTAVNGVNFQNLPTSVTFAAGSRTAVVTINPINDNLAGGTRDVVLTLDSNPAFNLGRRDAATVNIRDAAPTVLITAGRSAIEANPIAPRDGIFTFTRTGDLSQPLTVDFTASGTGVSGADFVVLPTSVIIPAGERSTTLDLTPIANGVANPRRTVILTLDQSTAFNLSPRVARQSATLGITDTAPFVPIQIPVGPTFGDPFGNVPPLGTTVGTSPSIGIGAGSGTGFLGASATSFGGIPGIPVTTASAFTAGGTNGSIFLNQPINTTSGLISDSLIVGTNPLIPTVDTVFV